MTRQRRIQADYTLNSGACITHLKMDLDLFHLRNMCHAGRMITGQKDWDWHEVPEKWKLDSPRRWNMGVGIANLGSKKLGEKQAKRYQI